MEKNNGRSRSLLRLIMRWMPKRVRFSMIRNSIKIPMEPPPADLTFKIAESQEELEQAYKILHDSYVESGFQIPDPSGMRILKYFALPTTTTLVAKVGDQVVGTMSVIRRGPFGLPIESQFDLTQVTAHGKTVVEVSSLAIASKFRHRRGTLFLPLCKFFYTYVRDYMCIDRCVIVVNPAWADFYEGYLDFKPLDRRVVGKYDFANGAPAVAFYSDVKTWADRFQVLYGKSPDSTNFHKYLIETKLECMKFPERAVQKAMDPVMTPEMLNYFFRTKSHVFDSLSMEETLSLQSVYPQRIYQSALPKIKRLGASRALRFVVQADGQVKSGPSIHILDASMTGVCVRGPLPTSEEFVFEVQISQQKTARLKGLKCWEDTERESYGVRILEADETWKEYMQALEADFQRPAMSSRTSAA